MVKIIQKFKQALGEEKGDPQLEKLVNLGSAYLSVDDTSEAEGYMKQLATMYKSDKAAQARREKNTLKTGQKRLRRKEELQKEQDIKHRLNEDGFVVFTLWSASVVASDALVCR